MIPQVWQAVVPIRGHLAAVSPELMGSFMPIDLDRFDQAILDALSAEGRLSAGEFFGEIALIAERTRTATITALSPCKLLLLHKVRICPMWQTWRKRRSSGRAMLP